MGFTKLLGLFDLTAALFLLLMHLDVNIPIRFVVVVSLLLLIKAYAFKDCWISYFDGFVGLYILLLLLGLHSILTIILLVFMAQKGIVSLF